MRVGATINERAIMRKRNKLIVYGGNMRLSFFPTTASGSGITRMPYGNTSVEMGKRFLIEYLVDKSKVLVDQNRLSVSDGNACALLSSMLQGLQPEAG